MGLLDSFESFRLWNSKLNSPAQTSSAMPAPTFGRIPPSLWDESKPPLKNSTACFNLQQLDQFIGVPRGHAHGSWGYTVLRTTYTPEADTLFPLALARLKSYIRWWCHFHRFPLHHGTTPCDGTCGAAAEPNAEISRRLYLDVVEDREGLAHLDGGGDGSAEERFTALGAYFRRWAAGVDTGVHPHQNPRYVICVVMDSESVASLARLPEELPPLRCVVGNEEARIFLGTGEDAWVWLLEADYMAEPEEHDDEYHGWLRTTVYDFQMSWFTRLERGTAPCYLHVERPEGSGIFYFDAL